LRTCFFISDLHGHIDRYQKLFARITDDRPAAVFFGGDLLPHGMARMPDLIGDRGDFINDFMVPSLGKLKKEMGPAYPEIFVILGNDDARIEDKSLFNAEDQGLLHYIHNKKYRLGQYTVYGYAHIPPSPFQLKDWERYDVSRHIDPGCIPPTDGWLSIPIERHEIEYGTIAKDLANLAGDNSLKKSIFLFHCPPYKSKLDRAALDGVMVDHVPMDVHIGSIAIQRFIAGRQPLITLHGHAHESARLTGSWQDRIGETYCFSAAHDGPELALVVFDIEHPEDAVRQLI
jgi:Icc-related predicted phosphoesterase